MTLYCCKYAKKCDIFKCGCEDVKLTRYATFGNVKVFYYVCPCFQFKKEIYPTEPFTIIKHFWKFRDRYAKWQFLEEKEI
ncbi:MAG: hypothetical protein DRN12_07870 [Thermoplasmata archaeon]|nr:MAG: hypothetical protein DRN12_07870 [Thermoplasmata archaeon]